MSSLLPHSLSSKHFFGVGEGTGVSVFCPHFSHGNCLLPNPTETLDNNPTKVASLGNCQLEAILANKSVVTRLQPVVLLAGE